jgi:hypothetical protein
MSNIPEPLENTAEVRRSLSIPHANILAFANAMYADRGHRDACGAKLDNLTRHLRAANDERDELLEALRECVRELSVVAAQHIDSRGCSEATPKACSVIETRDHARAAIKKATQD